ncbi:MAG: 3-hydroxybutyryl-CoA dehydrogenase, partial [Actinomycetota bacterium]|nr:3-hydroxybutyryl-CoA dehydrogenase [Actinomycetota bacterium]
MSSVPEVVGVVGGGRMGVGIAHAFLTAGSTVVVLERDSATAATAQESLCRAIDASVARQSTSESRGALIARTSTTVDVARLATAELAVEAVPEDLELKLEMLRRVESSIPTDAWLCSNTSSL